MWKKRNTSDNHYTDQDLLCHLDGELSKRAKRAVSEHLDVCWLCRTRRERLETQVRLISTSAQVFRVTPGWLDGTRRRFVAFQGNFEREFRSTSRLGAFWPRSGVFGSWLYAAVACLVMAAAAIGVVRLSAPQPVPSARSVIRNVDLSGSKLTAETVHQVFEVEESQVEPQGPVRRTRLEIWSDATSHRYASKWTGMTGSLKSGRWRTGGGSSFLYSPQTARAVQVTEAKNVLPAFSRIEPDVDVLEAGFTQWLKDRPWTPIASLADLSLWERQGALLQVERISNGMLRLTARQEIRGVQVDFLALIDEANYSLRLQKVRLEGGHRVVEFQLSSEVTEKSFKVSPAVFYPDREALVTKSVREAFVPARPFVPPATDVPKAKAVLAPDPSALVRRVEAYYILHQAGACRGLPVTVSAEYGGVRVSGQNLPPESSSRFFTKVADVSDVMAALSAIRDADEQRSTALPAGSNALATRDTYRQLVTDADALQTLAAAFDESQARVLPDAAVHLLHLMIQDHAASLSTTLRALSDPAELQTGQTDTPQDEATVADWRAAAASLARTFRSLTTSGSPDLASSQASIQSLLRTIDELTAQSRVELDRDQNSAAMHKWKNGK